MTKPALKGVEMKHMPVIRIVRQHRYPKYDLLGPEVTDEPAVEAYVSQETYNRIIKALEEYNKVQDILFNLYESKAGARR